ncbi:MAG TPA: elongation factor G [Caulobacteraceae bacterium]|jgi:elongation factor G|nr:elongation factor G [Caulobacteraceae bacterium]
MRKGTGGVRAIALVGPGGSGKTTLLEALASVANGSERQGGLGDTTPEAKARGQSVELNLAAFEFMGERYALIDAPGSVEFACDGDAALAAVDLALLVIDPDPAKAALLQPFLKQIEALGVPHAIFVNKIDQARGNIQDLIAALQPVSRLPLVARQIPISRGEHVAGFVDLALERGFIYRPGKPSEQVAIPEDLATVEADARFHMLEQLADYDDELMEQLLTDAVPDRDAVFADIVRETGEGLIAPVFFGSAQNGFGLRRLLKALRHDTPEPDAAATRLGAGAPCAYVFKTSHAGQAGKLAYARVLGGKLADGAELTRAGGDKVRASGLFLLHGATTKKVSEAAAGEIVAIGRLENATPGELLSSDGKQRRPHLSPPSRLPVYALSIAAREQKDDVRLSTAIAKLVEEDRGLALVHDAQTREVLLKGQGEGHLRAALDRLKRRYGLDVAALRPKTPYRETIRKGVTVRGRHKKQTGGHGQFGDVVLEIRPLARGEGFSFTDRITGGVVPKQWIPAVEQGVRDALELGPLGFPVIDVGVVLTDGSYHAVDSSEFAFRAAGRLAMHEGLPKCEPVLLEPIEKLTIFAPSTATSRINSAVSARRGQILGFDNREDWPGWDRIEVFLPHAERADLIVELRSVTQGLATYEAQYDHMAELTGRLADEVTRAAKAA